MINIAVCGPKLTGKTSFINALIGFPINIIKETSEIAIFTLNDKGSLSINGSTLMNRTNVRSRHPFHMNIIDLPALNNDSLNFLENVIRELEINVLIYVSTNTEPELFDKVQNLVKQFNNEGTFINFLSVINKLDNGNNLEDLKDTKTFRFSSHVHLLYTMNYYNMKVNIPESMKDEFYEIFKNSGFIIDKRNLDVSFNFNQIGIKYNGDWDNLLSYIYKLKNNWDQELIEFAFKFVKNNLPLGVSGKKIQTNNNTTYEWLDNNSNLVMSKLNLIKSIFLKYDLRKKKVNNHLYELLKQCKDNYHVAYYLTNLFPEIIDSKLKYALLFEANKPLLIAILAKCHYSVEEKIIIKILLDESSWCDTYITLPKSNSDYDILPINDYRKLITSQVNLYRSGRALEHLYELSLLNFRELIIKDINGKIYWDVIKSLDISIHNNLKLRMHTESLYGCGPANPLKWLLFRGLN